MHPPPDTVVLSALELAPRIGRDQWGRDRPQRVLLSVQVHTPLAPAGASDDVTDTIHYGHLSSALFALEQTPLPSLAHLALAAAAVARAPPFAANAVHVRAEAPKLLLQAHSLLAELEPGEPGAPPRLHMHIAQLAIHTIIGVNPPERLRRQQVVATVTFWDCNPDAVFPHDSILQRLSEHNEASAFRTLEAFATSLAQVACLCDGMDRVTVQAQKPSAVAFGHSSGVQLTRDRAFFRTAREHTPGSDQPT